jgi:hypothetical protein
MAAAMNRLVHTDFSALGKRSVMLWPDVGVEVHSVLVVMERAMNRKKHITYEEAADALMFYHREHKVGTVRDFLSRWAPMVDGNDTNRFIGEVSEHLGIGPDDRIDLDDPGRMQSFIRSLDACGLMLRASRIER